MEPFWIALAIVILAALEIVLISGMKSRPSWREILSTGGMAFVFVRKEDEK